VDAMCEAKRERCARAVRQSLAEFTEVLRRRVLVGLFPQTIGLYYERIS
jgi:hypothetical protein